jgi:glycosyltransferase involved in cell wall biosynthesis
MTIGHGRPGERAYYNARRMQVSVVVPVLNEEHNVRELWSRLARVLDAEGVDFEVIFVDDGSTDATPDILRALHDVDARVKSLRLARNFGHQAAISAGLRACGGDAVVTLDGDLQDAPELLPAFLERWRAGYQVVYAVREQRAGSPLKRAAYRMFYRMLQRLSHVPLPLDSGDFSLMDRRVVDVLNAMPERVRFVRGMRSWVGFRQTGVPQTREARFAGRPKYTYRKLVRLALDGFVGFSYRPLQLASLLGIIVSGISLMLSVLLVLLKLIHGIPLVGWTSLIVAVLFLGGIQLICVGILGEYVGRIYDEVRQRPPYVVASVLGKTRLDAGP